MFRSSLMIPIVLGWGCYLAMGQTKVDLQNQSRGIDFSAATSTKPAKTGASLPATCTTGDAFVWTAATAGQNWYICTATNTWTLQAQEGPEGPTGPTGPTGATGATGATGSISAATSLYVGDGTASGYVDLYPAGDTTDSIGFVAPSSRTAKLRLMLPSADPTAGQGLVCSAPSSNVSTCTWSSSSSSSSGLTDPTTTTGDLIYRSSSGTTRLGIGSTGQVLTVASGLPAWATPSTSAYVKSVGNTGSVSMTGSAVALYSVSSVPALASGACYIISGAEYVSAGGTATAVYIDSTLVHTPFSGSGGAEYEKWSIAYCNDSGSQAAQHITQVDGGYCQGTCGDGTNWSNWSGGLLSTPTAFDWTATHTISVKSTASSGNTATGLYFRIGQ